MAADTALILSGGGARAAYQVGVLQAISELCSQAGVHTNPFPVVCGTSAGALNAAMLASGADRFGYTVRQLVALWSELSSERVHRVGFGELIESSLKLLGSFFRSGETRGRPLSLLDNAPLSRLLHDEIDMSRIATMINEQHLRALSITAMAYESGQSCTFFQGAPDLSGWQRMRRRGRPTVLHQDHLLASAAIPAIFPAVRIGNQYFGDGAVRQMAPISPALHLGASRVLVVGVSGNDELAFHDREKARSPSLAEMMGQLMNSAFIDAMEDNIELLERFNEVIEHLNDDKRKEVGLRYVEALTINPSIRFDEVAARHMGDLPASMRWFLRTVGARRAGSGASMASYLLFERGYTRELMEHGYQDALAMREEIRAFFVGEE